MAKNTYDLRIYSANGVRISMTPILASIEGKLIFDDSGDAIVEGYSAKIEHDMIEFFHHKCRSHDEAVELWIAQVAAQLGLR